MKIQLDSLKDGSHRLDWSGRISGIDLAYPDIEAKVNVSSRVDRLRNVITLTGEVSGELERPCDRTLELTRVSLVTTIKLVIQVQLPGNTSQDIEDDEDILTLSNNTEDLDLTDMLRERLVIQMPMAVYKDGTEAVDEGDALPEGDDDDIDPRWAGLKSIKF